MERNRYKGRRARRWVLLGFSCSIIVAVLLLEYWNLIPKKWYKSEEFGITTIISSMDYNSNSIDDYTDFLLGARNDAKMHPTYNGQYYTGGYPPEDMGVCTDVVWRAFRQAGYSLREMVDNDILSRPEAYPNITRRDNNIDFRRVGNLQVFFRKYAIELTLDPSYIEEWQAGDIIIWENKHIGIISDKRNRNGEAYVIHNAGQPKREEDALRRMKITGHFRFDASVIEEDVLKDFQESSQS